MSRLQTQRVFFDCGKDRFGNYLAAGYAGLGCNLLLLLVLIKQIYVNGTLRNELV